MDVILINPSFNEHIGNFTRLEDVRLREPLSILAVGSYLYDKGYNVKIIDAVPYSEVDDNSYMKLIEKEVDNAACIGISAMTAQVKDAISISKFIKNIKGDVPIVWGGVHPTLFPVQTSVDPLVDVVVCGEGEATLLELLQKLEKRGGDIKNLDLSDIRGIAYNGHINPQRGFLDIDGLPFLNHDLLDLRFYLPRTFPPIFPTNKRFRKLVMLSSRGCPHRCAFCINSIFCNKWRGMSPERFLDEMEFIVNKYKLDIIRPLDENFFVDIKRAEAIIEGIKERRIDVNWASAVRADYFRPGRITAEFAKKLADSRFIVADMGAESGSDRILNMIKKDITTGDILNSAKICKEAGIIPVYSWMIGFPGQTKDEMAANINIMKKIQRICPSARHFDNFIFRPYPGGELYEECKKLGLYEPKTLRGWEDVGSKIGYTDVEELPWIKDKSFAKFISSNSQILVYSLGTVRNMFGFLIMILALIAKIRWRLGFFRFFNQELYVRKLVLKLLRGIKK